MVNTKKMDMNLREWLAVLGGVVIAGIVIDGIRRMRRAKRDSMEISLGMGGEIENSPLDEGFNPELPNGGARLAGSARANSADDFAPVDETETAIASEESTRIEPSIKMSAFDQPHSEDENLSAPRVVAREPQDSVNVESSEQLAETETVTNTDKICATKPQGLNARGTADDTKPKSKMTFGEGLKASNAKAKPTKAKTKRVNRNTPPKPAQEVIVLNVMSKQAEGFKGGELRKLLEACGVEHGDMSIFHRHEDTVDSPVQFSVANAVEPGYFPKEQLDSMVTPGISFFMSLPGPDDNMRAFDYMVETAQCVVRNLSGEMKDERRSDMTPQTLEHCRQRIRDFERRQLAAKC